VDVLDFEFTFRCLVVIKSCLVAIFFTTSDTASEDCVVLVVHYI
jgi:hypothetical protein